MDVCPCFSVLCCSAYIDALRWADPLSRESYQLSKQIHKFQKIISELEQAKRPNP